MKTMLSLDGVAKRYGDTTAVDEVSLDVEQGELIAVLGPSGCGKSTLLRAIAGLARIDAGTIEADGRLVAGPSMWVPPERRSIGMVFQDSALFPHLSVEDNVAFGLARRTRDRRRRVHEALSLVGLERLAGRFPHELSGGEQQRVALARALAPRPVAVLLDEPFSSLDRNLRVQVRDETVAALRAADATAVLVTHDQEEALAVGDRVAVMRSGRIEQLAEPADVFHCPATRFVATFLGEADFLPGAVQADLAHTALGDLAVQEGAPTGEVEVMVRPHDVALAADPDGPAVVERVEFRGATLLITVTLDDGTPIRAVQPHSAPLPVGTRVSVRSVAGHRLMAFA